jgi:hypothetical protein
MKYHMTNTDNPIDFPKSENIKAGADIHAGDGGYSIGTQEKYDEFVKSRNQSLIEKLTGQALDRAVPETWTTLSHEQLGKFSKVLSELIVRECAKFMDENSGYDDANNAWYPEPEDMLKHFGVKE